MKKLLLCAALIGVAVAICLYRLHGKTTLDYWQSQAVDVRIGMTRTEAEKLLPPQVPDGSLLWRLENWRETRAPILPRIKTMLAFQLWHGGNNTNWEEYEVSKGIFVSIGYDMTGSNPPRTPKGLGVLQPGDRVIVLPKVTTQSSGYPVEFFR
jgi:hypothetical protein